MSEEIKKEPEEPEHEVPDTTVNVEIQTIQMEEVDIKPEIIKTEFEDESESFDNSCDYEAFVQDRMVVKLNPEAYQGNQCDDVATTNVVDKKVEVRETRATRRSRLGGDETMKAKRKLSDWAAQRNRERDMKKNTLRTLKRHSIAKHISVVIITEEQRVKEHERMVMYLDSEYTCSDCAMGFNSAQDFYAHNTLHEPKTEDKESTKCDICNTYRHSTVMLYSHRKQHFRRFRCELCKTMFREREVANNHVVADHPKECRINPKATPNKLPKSKGKRFNKYNQQYVCSTCNNRYKHESYLRQHILRVHERTGQWLACHCGRVFPTRSRLHEHEVNIHGVGVVPVQCSCELCGKTFKNKSLLNRHKTIHSGQTYPCSTCGARFKTKGYVQIHFKTKHLNMTRKEIRAQTQKYKPLWVHDVTQGNIKFSDTVPTNADLNLQTLMEVSKIAESVADKKKYACDQCGKEFQSKYPLTRHLAVHSDNTYPCNECDAKFKTRGYVKIHYKKKHLNMTLAEIRGKPKKDQKNGKNKEKRSDVEGRHNGNGRANGDGSPDGNELDGKIVENESDDSEVLSSYVCSKDTFVNPSPVETALDEKDPLDCNDDSLQVPLFDTFIDIAE